MEKKIFLGITKAFTLHFPRKTERSVLSSFMKKKKSYMITQDGNKAGEEKRVCLGQRLQMEIHVSAVERQLKECQNTRWKTIFKSHRTPSDCVKWDLAPYLRQSRELLGLVFIWRRQSVGSQFPVGESSRNTWTELWLWAHNGMVYELQFLKWTTTAL